MTRYGDCLRRAGRVIVSLHEHDGWLARCYSSGTHLDDIAIEVDDDAPADEALEEAKRMFPDASVFLDDDDD